MNMSAARSKALFAVARRSRDVPVLSWTKIRCLPSTKFEKNDRSTTSGPTFSLQRNHLVSAASEGQRHTKKQISPDLKNGQKTKLPI
jgi:hypothetical protein